MLNFKQILHLLIRPDWKWTSVYYLLQILFIFDIVELTIERLDET